MRFLRTIFGGLALTIWAMPAQAGLLGPSSYWECILEEMQGVQNDSAAQAVMRTCKQAFPNISRVQVRNPLFGIRTAHECIAEHGKGVNGAKAIKLMRTACNRVYPR